MSQSRARVITCSSCGRRRRHQARGLCGGCYSRLPLPTAKRRWYYMIRRCTDPRDREFCRYGARGITVCDRWLESFDAYYSDVGDAPEGMSLDRIDNDGPYAPGNVRWATPVMQRANSRDAMTARTHCPQGHPYDEVNTYRAPGSRKRDCRACRREATIRYQARRRAAA